MPRIDQDIKLDFKDVLFRPKRSTIRSRADVSMPRITCFFKVFISTLDYSICLTEIKILYVQWTWAHFDLWLCPFRPDLNLSATGSQNSKSQSLNCRWRRQGVSEGCTAYLLPICMSCGIRESLNGKQIKLEDKAVDSDWYYSKRYQKLKLLVDDLL